MLSSYDIVESIRGKMLAILLVKKVNKLRLGRGDKKGQL